MSAIKHPICTCADCGETVKPRLRNFGKGRYFWLYGCNLNGRNYCYSCWPAIRLREIGLDAAVLPADIMRFLANLAAPCKSARE